TRKFKQYSSGNRQKLGLILALMHKPLVLIMDEPTLGLDPLLQNEIYEIFAELKADGRTIFISSHNLSEVERVCDTVGIIKDGKLAGVENVSDLRKKSLRKVLVRFAGKFKADDLQVSGVERVEEISDGVILTVRADINPVVKTLAKYELSDLEITRATLEDVFLQFYRGA
ncbi:MAG: AAA family ATPase, partial [Terriglobia bacterium]